LGRLCTFCPLCPGLWVSFCIAQSALGFNVVFEGSNGLVGAPPKMLFRLDPFFALEGRWQIVDFCPRGLPAWVGCVEEGAPASFMGSRRCENPSPFAKVHFRACYQNTRLYREVSVTPRVGIFCCTGRPLPPGRLGGTFFFFSSPPHRIFFVFPPVLTPSGANYEGFEVNGAG